MSVLESLKGMLMYSKRVRVGIKRFLEKGRGSAAPEEGREERLHQESVGRIGTRA